MYTSILVPIDLNHPTSWERCLNQAVELCQHYQAPLHILSIVPEFKMPMVAGFFPQNFEEKARQTLVQTLYEVVQQHVPATVEVQQIIATGKVYEVILNTASEVNADLIILSASLFPKANNTGPNAEYVARMAQQSVLLVR